MDHPSFLFQYLITFILMLILHTYFDIRKNKLMTGNTVANILYAIMGSFVAVVFTRLICDL